MMQQQVPIDSAGVRAQARTVRADEYFNAHLGKQQQWYDAKASAYKRYAQSLSLIIIIAGSLTAFLQIFAGMPGPPNLLPNLPPWPAITTALLALVVVLAEGLARLGRYRETWVAYRKASEQMKREYRLYVNNAGGYEKIPDEDAAYRHFVESVEQVIAEEQQLYWQSSASKSGEGADAPKPAPPVKT